MKQQTIKNDFLELSTLEYGAIIQKLWFRDKHGNPHNCVVGFDDPRDYLQDDCFIGACVGRFAGRIAGSELRIADRSYPIQSEQGIHLHGGEKGLGRQTWTLREVSHAEDPFITYSYLSPHMEEGYPGNLNAEVTYQLLGNSLRILLKATTDKATLVNLTNHAYYQLDGEPVPDHLQLQVSGEYRLETRDNLVPTGKLLPVAGTAYDFLEPRALGAFRLDTPYVVHPEKNPKVTAWSPVSGVRLKVDSNQPAVVVYTPKDRPAICFETQNYPDAPNHPDFPSCLLHPGETYVNESFFRFDLVP